MRRFLAVVVIAVVDRNGLDMKKNTIDAEGRVFYKDCIL